MNHDGGVAVIRDHRLVTSVEIEKLANNERYSELGDLSAVDRILASVEVAPSDVDAFVVDGWRRAGALPTCSAGRPVEVSTAPYGPEGPGDDVLSWLPLSGLPLPSGEVGYTSCSHVGGHVLAAYCTSPFAASQEPTHVLIWDGGIDPQLFHVRPPVIDYVGPLFPMRGRTFAMAGMRFPPFRPDESVQGEALRRLELTLPGKMMAYAALGRVDAELEREMAAVHERVSRLGLKLLPSAFADGVEQAARARGATDAADVVATLQHYLGALLAERLRAAIGERPVNLCLGGGCALNVKWNAAIRESGVGATIWVPPFPNDSGAAIGAACAAMVADGRWDLEWDVYSGPELGDASVPSSWLAAPCSPADLGRLLHDVGEPVVVLHGRAELGPRALGNRSILAPAGSPAMKGRLNLMKGREGYRPVAPVCLEDVASELFDPGGPEPYMLFDHRVRAEARDRIPAVMHLDGSARLQTVTHAGNPVLAAELESYRRTSGTPVLCNTSANFAGSGFFPDAASAAAWAASDYVWANETLFVSPAAEGRDLAPVTAQP